MHHRGFFLVILEDHARVADSSGLQHACPVSFSSVGCGLGGNFTDTLQSSGQIEAIKLFGDIVSCSLDDFGPESTFIDDLVVL